MNDNIYLFDGCTLDLTRGCVLRSGEPVHLRPQTFEVLKYLAENKGRLISKERIIEEVWKGRAVTESSVAKCIEELREALGGEARHSIRNVRGRGYIFDPDVHKERDGHVRTAQDFTAADAARSLQTDRVSRVKGAVRKYLPVAVIAVMIIGVVGAIYLSRNRIWPPRKPPSGKITLVVLPFENPSGNPDEEYFSDGLTEEMITELANLQPDRLGVIARSSAMRFKGSGKGIDQIAQELGVDYVLESSVYRFSGRLRITVRLIQASDQTTLWAHRYERELHDVLAIQSEVAHSIAGQIALHLTPNQERRLASARQINPEAFEAYLKGLYFWDKFTESGMLKSIELFQQAINKQPDYAQPYARMARAYGLLGNFSALRPEQAYPRQKEAALRALELDGTLAEAHTALGWTKLFYERDWVGAKEEFQRAIELSPNFAAAHQGYGIYCVSSGNFDEAMSEIRKAEQLDPVSLNIKADVGWFLFYARRTDESIAKLKEVLEMDPNFAVAHVFLSHAYQQKGMFDQAVAEAQKAINLFGEEYRIAPLGHAYALAGKRNEARQILTRLSSVSRERYISPYTTALIYASLGQKDEAFRWLEQSYIDRFWMMALLKVDPRWDSLRSDPRFADLLQRTGLQNVPQQ